jgi:antirestriction protein ArdC
MQPYERITAAILAAIESELPSWRRPWRTLRESGAAALPVNAVSGRAYRGINTFLLWSRQDADMRYLTYRQAQALGGNVRRGEHGTQVVFWQPRKYKARDAATGEEEERQSLLVRLYTVFNVSQCENLKLKQAPDIDRTVPPSMADIYSRVGARVEHGGDVACFIPAFDIIRIPHAAAFSNGDAYAATALHELTHWSGHESRLNRDLRHRFGTALYAAEELVAELGSAYLCASLGVNSALEHHASYIQHWRSLLKSDPRAVITAASKAQAAADYLLERMGCSIEEEEALAA